MKFIKRKLRKFRETFEKNVPKIEEITRKLKKNLEKILKKIEGKIFIKFE